MQKHNDAVKTSGYSSFEKYTSDFIWKGSKGLLKVLLCERWVGDWTELQHIDAYSHGHNSVSFPFSWAVQPGAWGPDSLGHSPHSCIFSPTDLNFLSLGLYNNLRPLFFLRASQFRTQFNPSTVDIPRPDAPVIYTGAFPILTAWLGRRSICNTQIHVFPKGIWAK